MTVNHAFQFNVIGRVNNGIVSYSYTPQAEKSSSQEGYRCYKTHCSPQMVTTSYILPQGAINDHEACRVPGP